MPDLHRLRALIRPRWFSTAALAAGLAVLLAGEWLLPGPAAPAPRQPAAIPVSAPDQEADAAIGEWGSTALARPLFSASRRPVQQAAPVAAADDTLPRLSAIIVTDGTRSAIFAAPGEKPQAVVEGGEIGPYRLTAIAPGRVQLLGPQGLITLRPQFLNAGPAAVAN